MTPWPWSVRASFDLVVRQVGVLYGGPPPSGQFDQEMEVFDGHFVLADEVQTLQSVAQPAPSDDAKDRSLGF